MIEQKGIIIVIVLLPSDTKGIADPTRTDTHRRGAYIVT